MEFNCKKKVTAAKDPFSSNSGIYKQDKLKGQKTCPFCFSTNSAVAAKCENCNGLLAGVPVTIGPQQPDQKKKKHTDNKINVAINAPIANTIAQGEDAVEKTAQVEMQTIAKEPINPKARLYSDPNVEDQTVDDDLATQIEDSADGLALED